MMGRQSLKKKVIIVEDDVEIRESFKIIINSSTQFKVVNTFSNSEDAIKSLSVIKPEIILMDITLPGMDGIEATKIIKADFRNIDIVMVSVHEESSMVLNALKAGASGYMSKSSNYNELIQSLEEIAKGGAPMSCKIARMIVEDLRANHKSLVGTRETSILHRLADGKTYTQIAEEMSISKETVKSHIKKIYRKLPGSE